MTNLQVEINPYISEEFYKNWYFYQEYKKKPHYPKSHIIRYE